MVDLWTDEFRIISYTYEKRKNEKQKQQKKMQKKKFPLVQVLLDEYQATTREYFFWQ